MPTIRQWATIRDSSESTDQSVRRSANRTHRGNFLNARSYAQNNTRRASEPSVPSAPAFRRRLPQRKITLRRPCTRFAACLLLICGGEHRRNLVNTVSRPCSRQFRLHLLHPVQQLRASSHTPRLPPRVWRPTLRSSFTRGSTHPNARSRKITANSAPRYRHTSQQSHSARAAIRRSPTSAHHRFLAGASGQPVASRFAVFSIPSCAARHSLLGELKYTPIKKHPQERNTFQPGAINFGSRCHFRNVFNRAQHTTNDLSCPKCAFRAKATLTRA
jgi:hypothetical protein